MDYRDGFHIDDAYFENDKFFEAKTNIKRKRILSYFGLPDSEGRIVYYKDTGIMIVFLDYWDYNSKIDLWENGKSLHLRGTKEYDLENDINQLNIKDNALYFLDRNDIAVHLFWAEEKDKYRYGHVMVPQNIPYQIQELSANGTLKFERNDIEDTLMIKDISNITFNLNLRDFINTSERPKPKQQSKEINGIFVYKRDRTTAFHALQLADFKCEISKDHKSFIRKSTNQNYTEPHHLIPMAYSDKFKVSLDVEANIVSLCSTCHNHIHYGVGAEDLLTALYYQRIKRLRAVGLDISLEELLQMYDIK